MLIGEYRSKVTSGKRVALPKKFRGELGNRFIVTQGYEGCLVAVSYKQWQKVIEEAASGPFVSVSVRDTSRFLIGGAHEITLDDQGRFVIPDSLIRYAKIKVEVTFLGLNRWLEIWDSATWAEKKRYLEKHSGEIAEKLANLKI